MKHHELKVFRYYFQSIIDGWKTFEIRNNDRDFREGDTIVFLEYDPELKRFSGREHTAKVGYVTEFEQKPGYVVFSLLRKRINWEYIVVWFLAIASMFVVYVGGMVLPPM